MVKEQKALTTITRDFTIHLHKRLHRTQFKKKAPKAIKVIKDFTSRIMKTKDVRVDSKLNEFIWSKGVRNVPYRVRVRLSRKRNEDENAKEEMYTLVQYVPIDDFSGMRPEKVETE
jgi:large subunit ribosomal protein L31e